MPNRTELLEYISLKEFPRNLPNHANHSDYELTLIEANTIRLRHLRFVARNLNAEVTHYNSLLINSPEGSKWLPLSRWVESHDKLLRILREIKYTKGLLSGEPERMTYNIEHIKSIPLDSLYDILPSGFFLVNPLREEKRSPSTSLHWNKGKNRWCDYHSGEHGDNIDMVMKTYKISFMEACKMLNNK